MRASAETRPTTHDGWRPVHFARARDTAADLLPRWRRSRQSRWGFLAWCIVSFFIWNGGFLALAARKILDTGAAAVAMLLWPVVVALSVLPFAWLSGRRIEARHQRELAELHARREEANLRLLVLQAQIEPHFLFNTLASLRALLREDVRQAETMVDALVRHLRAVLPAMRGEIATSTLGEQIAICDSYLQLMAIRLENRLSWRVDVPASLMNTAVPPLMLLTLVENPVKHGIEPRSNGGSVCIEAEQVGPTVRIRVLDDGVGLVTGLGSGLGLKNIGEQLALRYGEHGVLALRSRPEGGAVASIHIPVTGGRAE